MIQFPEKILQPPPEMPAFPPLSLGLVEHYSPDDDTNTEEKSPTTSENSLPRVPDCGCSVASMESSNTNFRCHSAAVGARRRGGGHLSHLSESDRRSDFSYHSESISMAVTEPQNNRTGSKFKVVKLGDKIPYVRGRFVCFDFHDIPNREGGGNRMDGLPGSSAATTTMAPSRVQTPDINAGGAGGTLTSNVVVQPGSLSISTTTVDAVDGILLPVTTSQGRSILGPTLRTDDRYFASIRLFDRLIDLLYLVD